MKLDRVSIKNYRSIKELDLNFDPACKVLVGINESGKSNILRALELLDTTVQPTKKDLRDPVKSEKQPTEAYVRFIFKFGAKETAEIFGILKPKVLAAKITEPIINWRSRDLSLEEFCTGREGLYITNLMNSTKHFSVWTLVGGKILGSWKSVAEACPAEDRKSTRLNSSHSSISYAVFCLKKQMADPKFPQSRAPQPRPCRSGLRDRSE